MKNSIATFLCLSLGLSALSQSVWHDDQPYGDELDDIQFVDYHTGYAVGRDNGIGSCGSSIGALFRTMDGGETWTRNALDDSYEMTSVFFLDQSTGWASVYFGDVIKTTDCGQTWTLYDGNIGGDALDVYFLNENVGFLVGENGHVRKSVDGGVTWSFNYDTGNQSLYKVHFYDDALGFILGTQGLVLRTEDGGDSWDEIDIGTSSAIFDIDYVSDQVIFLSSYGSVYKSTDGGESFSMMELPVFSLRAVEFITGEVGFLAGESGELWKTTDAGLNWGQQDFPFLESIYELTFLDSYIGYMSGSRGSIFHTDDGGITWKNQLTGLRPPDSFGSQAHLRDVHFLHPDTGVVVGASGQVSLTFNGGLTWSRIPTPDTYELTSVQWIDGYGIVTAGEAGYFMYSPDMGSTWIEKETGTQQFITDLWFTEDGSTGYLLCLQDTILKTQDLGDSWEVQVPVEGMFYRDFDFLNEDFGLVVGNEFVYRTLDGGTTWEERPFFEAQSNLRCVEIVDDSLSYIGSTNMLVSRNGGGYWDSISVSTSLFMDRMEFLNDSVGYMITGPNVRMTIDSGRHWSSVTTACLNNSWSLNSLDVIDEHHVRVVGDSPTRRMWSGEREIRTKVIGESYCPGEKFSVGFLFDGYYISDNTYQAQLSDASGDFSSPIVLGSYTNDFVNRSPSGVISCQMPSSITEGTGYRIRVVAVDPETIGADNGFDIQITSSLMPSVALALETSGCGGFALDFSTMASQAGTMQSYLWMVNGDTIPHTAAYWMVDTLQEGDEVQVHMQMQSVCLVTEVASEVIVVPAMETPALELTESTIIDQGQSVQLEASGYDAYVWTPADFLDDDSIATPISAPDSTITYFVTATDDDGCIAMDSVTITVIPLIDGLEELSSEWSIGPNPVSTMLTIRYSGNQTPAFAQLYDAQGRLLESVPFIDDMQQIDMRHYASGIYEIRLVEDQRNWSYLLMKD